MLDGHQLEVVGVETEEGCECYCRACARAKWGEIRAQQIMLGVNISAEWGAPRPLTRYTAEEYARSNEEPDQGIEPFECCVECGTYLADLREPSGSQNRRVRGG